MTDSYWFKRSHSTTKPVETHSETFFKTNNIKHDIVLPDDSLKNQIKSSAYKLLEIAEGLNRSKRINQMLSDEIEQKGGEVRCTLHNSSIILYCINDHRLLCSVCVFSSENHKRHQLVEAAKAESFLEFDLRESEKILRGKIIDINRQKSSWADLLRQLNKNYTKSIEALQIQHEAALASISSAFSKIKIKLGEVFESTRESIEVLVKSYSDFAKCLKFDHPFLRVKHYYIQEVMDKKPFFDCLFPSIKIATQNVKILDKFAKSLVKNYRNQYV